MKRAERAKRWAKYIAGWESSGLSQAQFAVLTQGLDWRRVRVPAGDERGYRKLFLDTVQQADRGCDFEFLTRPVTARTPKK